MAVVGDWMRARMGPGTWPTALEGPGATTDGRVLDCGAALADAFVEAGD